MAIIGFKNGAHGVIQGSTVCYPAEPIVHSIFGNKGGVGLHDDRLAKWKFLKPAKGDEQMLETANDPEAKKASGGDPLAALGKPGDTHYPQIKDMVAAIRENRAPACSGADGRHAVEIILAIYESARRGGERLYLPLEGDFPSVGFPKDKKK
jgi:predicted dehydrogenase